MTARKKRSHDTRFDAEHCDEYIRLKKGFLGRRHARGACIICGIPQITETLENAHIRRADVELSNPASLDRVFQACRNHHRMYDLHIISTPEMIAADDRAVALAYGKRVQGEASPDCDRLFVADLQTGKRKADQVIAKEAVITRQANKPQKPDAPAGLFSGKW